jgi:hypothetical protein
MTQTLLLVHSDPTFATKLLRIDLISTFSLPLMLASEEVKNFSFPVSSRIGAFYKTISAFITSRCVLPMMLVYPFLRIRFFNVFINLKLECFDACSSNEYVFIDYNRNRSCFTPGLLRMTQKEKQFSFEPSEAPLCIYFILRSHLNKESYAIPSSQ